MDLLCYIVMCDVLNDVFKQVFVCVLVLMDEFVVEVLVRFEVGEGKVCLEQFDFMLVYGWIVLWYVIWCFFGLCRLVDIEVCDVFVQMQMIYYGKFELFFMVGGMWLMVFMFMEFGKVWVQSYFGGCYYEGMMIGGVVWVMVLFLFGGKCLLKFSELLGMLQQIVLVSMLVYFLFGMLMLNLLWDDWYFWKILVQLCWDDKFVFDVRFKFVLDEVCCVELLVIIIDCYLMCEQEFCGVKLFVGVLVFVLIGLVNCDVGIGGGDFEQFIYDCEFGVGNLLLGYGIYECVGKVLQGIIVLWVLECMIEVMLDFQFVDKYVVFVWFDNVYFCVLKVLLVQCGRVLFWEDD